VKDVTLEEAWSGRTPSVSPFRVFGYIAYVHIPDNLRKKLDDKSIVCIYLGMSEESKAYKLYDPAKRKIVISKDVRFDEGKQWNWDSKEIEKTSRHTIDFDNCSQNEPDEPKQSQ
jgi:hypothetical protein